MFERIEISNIAKPKRQVAKVFVHCSASDRAAHDDARVIDRWHRERGFDEIGYHFFIKKDGTVQAGRSLEKTPAAQRGHNTTTIAICVHGLDVKKFTTAQRVALHSLCQHLNRLYGGALTFHGHHEVEPNKTCPVFNYREWLGLDKSGKMALTT